MFKKLLPFLMLCIGIGIVTDTIDAATGSTTIAKWKDNKRGAYSMGFDDSMQSHHDHCIPHLIKRGLVASFWVNPATTRYGYGIDTWESLVSRSGMELCAHTMNHHGANFIEEAEYEIGETARIIRSLKPPGSSKLLLFLRGGGTSWPEGYEFLINKYTLVSSRGTGAGYRGPDNARDLIAHARRAIDEGIWTSMATHGTGPYLEWLGFEVSNFEALLDFLASEHDRLWVGTCGSIYKYVQERDTAKVMVLEASGDLIRLDLTSDMDPDLYDYPLTLITEVPENWKYCHVRQGELQSIYPVTSARVQYEAIPGRGEIQLKSSSMDSTPPGKPLVRDGSGADIQYTPHTTRLSANWDVSMDAESGISRYWYKIGTTPGGADVLDWIDNGRSTSVTVTRTNLSLSRGATYYVTVKAVNGVGLSSEGTSDGQMVRLTSDYLLFAEDFEQGKTDNWEVNQSGGNTLSIAGKAARNGRYGLACAVHDNNGVTLIKRDVSTLDDNYVRFSFKLSPDFTIPENSSIQLMNLANSNDYLVAGIYLSAGSAGPYLHAECHDTKRRSYGLPASGGYPPGLAHISLDEWHTIDVRVKADAGNGGCELWIDGDRKNSFLRQFTNGWELRNLTVGVLDPGDGISGEIFFDDISVSDSYLE